MNVAPEQKPYFRRLKIAGHSLVYTLFALVLAMVVIPRYGNIFLVSALSLLAVFTITGSAILGARWSEYPSSPRERRWLVLTPPTTVLLLSGWVTGTFLIHGHYSSVVNVVPMFWVTVVVVIYLPFFLARTISRRRRSPTHNS